jgi:hypothetical protein
MKQVTVYYDTKSRNEFDVYDEFIVWDDFKPMLDSDYVVIPETTGKVTYINKEAIVSLEVE